MSTANSDQLNSLREVDHPTSPALSVLVRCRNEMRALPAFWRALQRQTAIAQVEVLVLDSGSTDGSLEYLLEQSCSVYQIAPETFNFGRSCNQLMHLAKASRVLFLSAHVLLESDTAIEECIAALNPERRQAGYLRQVPNTVLGFNAYEAAYLNRRFPPGKCLQRLTQPTAFSNAASILTKKAWLQHSFPEIHGSEDFQWAQEHLSRGGELFYLPHLIALHSHNETPDQVYRRVHLNVIARGQGHSYMRALFLFGGVMVQTLRSGASFREAVSFATGHARAYL